MAQNTIALNLRRIRKDRNLTQEQLANKVALSRAAYRKIETGKSEPRVSNLQAIATALEVGIQDLVAPVRELKKVRFRSTKRLRTREQILVDVGNWLRDFEDIEDSLDSRVPYSLANLKISARKNRGETAAALTREAFGLDDEEPIRDICGLLEAEGIKIYALPIASHDFFGLSVALSDGGPAIVVNTWERVSVERWIFTAAHELGHLVLHLSDYDVEQKEEEKEHEKEAKAFAAAFLMPEASFRKEWVETYGLGFVDRVLKVKRIFRVSYRTVLHRLAPEYRGPGNIWSRLQIEYKKRHGRTLLRDDEPQALAQDAFQASFPEHTSAGEPDNLSPVDFLQDRLSRLVRQAVEQEKISLSRGAEVLGLSLGEMRELTASWIG